MIVQEQETASAQLGRGVQNTPSALDEKIKQLQERKAKIEARQAENAAVQKTRDDAAAEMAARFVRELKAEAVALAKACPGESTGTACPVCWQLPMQRTGHVQVRPEDAPMPVNVSLGVSIFLLRRQKDGSLLCPRCGVRGVAY